MKTKSDKSLKSFHTFGLDVLAREIIEVQWPEDFLTLWQNPSYLSTPKLILGEGSNLLFCENFQGVIVLNRLKGISILETEQHWHLHVAAGENWHELVSWTIGHGMGGLENLALIPGLVGSAPIQNIGAYGVELKERCEYVDVLFIASGKTVRLSAAKCEFGYRDSVFKRKLKYKTIVVAVGLKLSKVWLPMIGYGALAKLAEGGKVTIRAVFDKVCEIRRNNLPDPHTIGNAGSFFKNPIVSVALVRKIKETYPTIPYYNTGGGKVKLAAGWLIEQSELKGFCVGGAAVHSKQALVLINTGEATSKDIIKLAKHVVDTVYQRFWVKLEHEVRFIGAARETSLEAVCQR
ncbi:UDP-N-acetylmuramate dehydrogenase [Candidatus Enterovibrio altilux]|uniref:UDP-N-acetylenolpyruvoylglucosamine reductase n=1 Tax=Candidatus Enterovibrio altilux TaxID=1927128 RepID=A0A291B9D7_9GAMM|nr:UDP-N-acetylmuramate dehydrogenase [Candidatus Enterovibrio luxaltus]ATF09615.1 UDP-N-acetylenolpyruvoylglucosamine reductase [Candidatus Enterovibrio luxaltus]